MNTAKRMASTCFAAIFALLMWGCTQKSNTQAPKVSALGQHPTDWMQKHWGEFTMNPDQCKTCHGSTTDPAAAGGISKVSCFTCHTSGVHHPAGWGVAAQHGRAGAMAAPATTQSVSGAVVNGTGFDYCAKCHGTSRTNGLTYPTCFACHTKAPHPDKPWHGTTPAGSNHIFVDPGNVATCYSCHANGANSTITPVNPAPAGTPPGCTNATMCHGRNFS